VEPAFDVTCFQVGEAILADHLVAQAPGRTLARRPRRSRVTRPLPLSLPIEHVPQLVLDTVGSLDLERPRWRVALAVADENEIVGVERPQPLTVALLGRAPKLLEGPSR
jgi:hypothetical protein